MKISALLILLLISFGANASSELLPKDICRITGEVLKIDLGEFSSPMETERGTIISNKVRYTRITMNVIESKTLQESSSAKARRCEYIKAGTKRKIGLCEHQTIKAGDVISGNTDGWADGPDCFVNVEFLK